MYEIRYLTLEKIHRPEVKAQAIRNYSRGEASNLLYRIEYGASISGILENIDSVYGEVDWKEHLYLNFTAQNKKKMRMLLNGQAGLKIFYHQQLIES